MRRKLELGEGDTQSTFQIQHVPIGVKEPVAEMNACPSQEGKIKCRLIGGKIRKPVGRRRCGIVQVQFKVGSDSEDVLSTPRHGVRGTMS